jgi:ubiquinone/menaquinone biosynthesis C-methylase UbiE
MPTPHVAGDESERVRSVFSRRAADGLDERYAYWKPENLSTFQERERVLLSMLRARGLLPLTETRVLDVGCGLGGVLRDFLRYGAAPERLAGVDLIEARIEAARKLAPNIDFRVASGAELPFDDGSFDLALCFTVFSSITDPATRTRVAGEMRRVLRPGGAVLWYDFWINPVNRDTRAVTLREAARLFACAPAAARRVSLAPPLARAVAPRSRLAAEMLGWVPLLRTSWMALLVLD